MNKYGVKQSALMSRRMYDAECRECGHEWELTLIEFDHYSEVGCPRCGSNAWSSSD